MRTFAVAAILAVHSTVRGSVFEPGVALITESRMEHGP